MEKFVRKLNNKAKEIRDTQFENIGKFHILDDFLSKITGNKIGSTTITFQEIMMAFHIGCIDDVTYEQLINDIRILTQQFGEFFSELTKHVSKNIEDDNFFDISSIDFSNLHSDRYVESMNMALIFSIYYTCNVDENVITRDLVDYMAEKTNLQNKIATVNRKHSAYVKENNRFVVEKQNILGAMQRVMNDILSHSHSNKMIYASNDLFQKINDDELLYEYYALVNRINNNYFVDISEKNMELKKNSSDYIKYIYNELGFNIDDLNEECLKVLLEHTPIDCIDKILTSLNSSPCELINVNSVDGAEALVSTAKIIINNIIILLNQGTITKSFIIKHPDILYFVNRINQLPGKYPSILSNYDKIIDNGFEADNSHLDEALLTDPDNFNSSLKTFEVYGLDKSIPLTYSVIEDNDFFKNVDLFIELGLYDFIKQNFGILKHSSKDIAMRIYVSKLMKINIFNDSAKLLDSVSTGNNFVIPNKMLENFVFTDYKNLMDKQICKYLDNLNPKDGIYEVSHELDDLESNFKFDDTSYVFGSHIISRKKVIRNYNYLRSLLPNYDSKYLIENSIIHNTFLSFDEIMDIKSKLDEIKAIQKKIK